MAIIQSGGGAGTALLVDPAFAAARVTERPQEVLAWNSVGAATGLVTGLATAAPLFSFRNLSGNPVIIRRVGIEVGWPLVGDWGTKSETGCELRTLVTVRVAKGQRARLPDIVEAVERIGASLGGTIDGWTVASAVPVRTQTGDERDGSRVARIEHRIRVLQN